MKNLIRVIVAILVIIALWGKVISPTLEGIVVGQTTALAIVEDTVVEFAKSRGNAGEYKSTPLAQSREEQVKTIYRPVNEEGLLSDKIGIHVDKEGKTELRFTSETPYEDILRTISFLHLEEIELYIEGIKTKEDLMVYMEGFQEAWKKNKAYLDSRESWSGLKWSYIEIQPYRVYLEIQYVLNKDELSVVNEVFKQKADAIKRKTKDPREQAKLAFEETVREIQYDDANAGVKLGVQESWVPRNSYTAIKKGLVVCSGYVDYYNGILDSLGIENVSVEGNYFDDKGNTVPHAWTEIKIGDQYFYSDPTFGDGYRNDEAVMEWFSFTELKDREESKRE